MTTNSKSLYRRRLYASLYTRLSNIYSGNGGPEKGCYERI